jgi:dihydrofolate reductase
VGCVNIALSVDGFIADKDGNVDWLDEQQQPPVEGEDYGFGDFLKSVDLMIMGRSTFDVVVGFGKEMWPYGDLPIVVYTRNVDHVTIPEWVPNTVFARSASSPESLWKELEEEEGKSGRVYIDGGRTIQAFMRAGRQQMTLSRIQSSWVREFHCSMGGTPLDDSSNMYRRRNIQMGSSRRRTK